MIKLALFTIGCLFLKVSLAESTHLSKKPEHKIQSQHEANILWKRFLNCGQSTSAVQEKCLRSVGTLNLMTMELNKLAEFLSFGFEVSSLSECTEQQKNAFVSSEINNLLCFKIVGNESEITGYFRLERYKGELRITKIQY